MGSPRKLLAIVATGASLVAFTTLGSDQPQGKAVKEAGGSQCRSEAGGSCCSHAAGQSARVPIILVRGNPSSTPEAAQQKTKEPAKAGPAAMAKGVATRKALLAQVGALMEDGVADCCIDPGCVFCPIAADHCACAGSLAKGGPVCPECWGGWQAGQGMLPNVQADKVQILPKESLKKYYGMKADKLDQANKK